jgi:formate dehydrogenase gamma subunit
MARLTVVDDGRYIRWTRNERIQHWLLAISFIVLVLTGFGLKYPDAWWVRPLAGVEWLFDLRGWLHRVAGGAFLLLCAYHTCYMVLTARGRLLCAAMAPTRKDIADLIRNMLYNLTGRGAPPKFLHFSYMEKLEYFALIWGTVIMGATGVMLWFQDFTLRFFPVWVIDLITVIHLYEAWLATLAILIWHLYYVVFNPDVYPLNRTIVNGEIEKEELQREYALEWEEMEEPAADDKGNA